MSRNTKVISISTMPRDLRRFDSAARRAGLSRSEFFNRAAERAIADAAPPARARARVHPPTNHEEPS